MSGDFAPEQKRYLEGFVSGIQARGDKSFPGPGRAPEAAAETKPMGPDAPHFVAQDAAVEAGKKLVDQEKWKREEHPFDAYHRLRDQAARDKYPKPADNSAGEITVSYMSHPRKIAICAGYVFPTVF